jgi:chromosomal replication initiator protein
MFIVRTHVKGKNPLATQDITEILANIVERAKSLDPVNSRKWFDELVLVQFDGGLLEIGCPDEASAQFLQDNCLAVFTQSVQNITGHLVSVKFGVSRPPQFSKTSADRPRWSPKLHPDYTFESFVVGPCNRLAHASCVAVSHSPGDTYNPLFLYGNVGLGKTHLLHAVCHGIRKRPVNTSIRFLSCEEFVNGFISAIEQGKLADFQSRFRTVDILIIDDVQFLQEREQSQEEFFHTFNALYNNRKQIVLTADCAPGELPSLEERLISRFKWGLVARLDAPGYETRTAIVQKKAHLRGLSISEEIAGYIARKVKSNIRELEGALTIIYATAKASDSPITLELAQQALGDQDVVRERHISITEIIDAVTEYFDVRLADLQSKKRSQSITLPRQICMYLARNLTKHSLEEIGGHLGGRDHSTVLHAYGKIQQLHRTDPSTRAQLNELTETIKQA